MFRSFFAGRPDIPIANNIIPGIIIKYQPLMGPELQQGICMAKLLQTPDSKIVYHIIQLYLYFWLQNTHAYRNN